MAELHVGPLREEEEFRQLFERQVSFIWNTLRRLGVSERDRKDVAQEVLLTLHGLLGDFDPTRPERPWIFGIAYRIAMRHNSLVRHTREVMTDAHAEEMDPAPNAERVLEGEQLKRMVHAAMSQIEPERRAVLLLAELEECSVPEIAEALSIPLNTAYSRLRLGREDLRATIRRMRARGDQL